MGLDWGSGLLRIFCKLKHARNFSHHPLFHCFGGSSCYLKSYCFGTARNGLKVSTSPITSTRFKIRNIIWSPAWRNRSYVIICNCTCPWWLITCVLHGTSFFLTNNCCCWNKNVTHKLSNIPGKKAACWRFWAHENLHLKFPNMICYRWYMHTLCAYEPNIK